MKKKKEFDELNLIDDFLMNIVASDPEVGEDFCRTLLSVLLQLKIGKIRVHVQNAIQGISPEHRGVRIDVEVQELDSESADKTVNVYDIEPHTTDEGHFERMLRFRQAKIDSRYMKVGDDDFKHLPNLYVLFITDFDVFKKDYMVYTIQNRCEEIPDLKYDDGLRFLYFYTKGTKGGSESIRNMLEYMQNSHEKAAVDDATKAINGYVRNVRLNPENRGKYMTFEEKIAREKKECYKEGQVAGKETFLIAQICKKLSKNVPLDQIALELEEDPAHISEICDVAKRYAPDYDADAIFAELYPDLVLEE